MANSPLPTAEETHIARESIMLQFLLDICQKQVENLQYESAGLISLSIGITESLMDRIHADLSSCRKSMRESKIKVIEGERERAYLHYKIICRSYESKFSLMKEYLKAELAVKLGEYVSKIENDLKSL